MIALLVITLLIGVAAYLLGQRAGRQTSDTLAAERTRAELAAASATARAQSAEDQRDQASRQAHEALTRVIELETANARLLERVAATEAQIAQEQQTLDAAAEAYNQAAVRLQATQTALASTTASLAAQRARLDAAQTVLRNDVIRSYTTGASSEAASQLFASPTGASQTRQIYQHLGIGDLAAEVAKVRAGQQELSATQAKAVLADLFAAGGGDPAAIARDKGFEAMSEDSLAATVAEAVADHPDEWARFCEGDDKLAGFFTGLVMKATRGQANGKAVAAELRRLRG